MVICSYAALCTPIYLESNQSSSHRVEVQQWPPAKNRYYLESSHTPANAHASLNHASKELATYTTKTMTPQVTIKFLAKNRYYLNHLTL